MGSKLNAPGLYEFLIEAELQHYYNAIKNELKVSNASQLKYVTEEDMTQIGMSKPEMRRLKKYLNKHFPQTYLAKVKKILSRKDDLTFITTTSSNNLSVTGCSSVRNAAPGRHIIQADAIVIHKTLGSGEFGTVQQGVWTSDDGQRIQVAIKCLSQERMENNPVEFLKEAAIMHTVDHEHIVRLYGVVLDTTALMLVTELAPLRSLLECLKEPSMKPNLSVTTLYDFAIQISDGMQYLESKRLIHRDLAARNILVFSRNKVKISDFGLSRALGVGKDYYQTNFNVNLKLPIAWCASECINFLRFTSASDVWAYGVTLWEMFSYGFQPWAALTGQQILEAIDEPNYQRLDKPECCPNEIYYQIMLKCWQHDPATRPTFTQLSILLPECKPEQVQAIRDFKESRLRRDFIVFDAGDIITVLDKKPTQGSDEGSILWKGVMVKSGISGLFHPANTITYLGSNLPSVKQTQNPFHRNDSRSSLRKSKLSTDMISGPQGELMHTGHVGTDGHFFGDITFLGSKCWVPRQVVQPYKPEAMQQSDGFLTSSRFKVSKSHLHDSQELPSSDTAPLLLTAASINTDVGKSKKKLLSIPIEFQDHDEDHEYHEISDEENEILKRGRDRSIGLTNPALSSKSQSPLESPKFENSFDLGPSLMDEVFEALQQEDQNPDESNLKNELREMARNKKKFATVKPISSSDRRTLDHAIAIANEIATKSMFELDRSEKHFNTNMSLDDISRPITPNSPIHRRKFSFILGTNKNSDRERRNYSQEAASIPDIQASLSEEAKEAYNSLIEKPSIGFLTPSYERNHTFQFPDDYEKAKDCALLEDASSLQENFLSFDSSLENKSKNIIDITSQCEATDEDAEDELSLNPLRLLRMNKTAALNILPLPPRERNISLEQNGQTRHQRKFPLLISGKGNIKNWPPPPPPKPQRQLIKASSTEEKSPRAPHPTFLFTRHHSADSETTDVADFVNVIAGVKDMDFKTNRASKKNSQTQETIKLYENFIETDEIDFNFDKLKVDNEELTKKKSNQMLQAHISKKMEKDNLHGAQNEISEDPNINFETGIKRTNCSLLKNMDVHSNLDLPDQTQSTNLNSKKIQIIKKVFGDTIEVKDCEWALNLTNGDSAHAVKFLRLKALIPESVFLFDIEKTLSILEMSHWDVALASSFLLRAQEKRTLNNSNIKETSNSSISNNNEFPERYELANNNETNENQEGNEKGLFFPTRV